MARVVKQSIPKPPPQYSQEHAAQMAEAINRYMIQRESLGEMPAGRFVLTDPVAIPGDLPNTSGLPNGMMYLTSPFEAVADSTVAQQAWANGTLTLTTAQQPVPGVSVTATYAGLYLFIAHFDFNVVGNEQGAYLYGTATGASHYAILDTGSKSGRNTVSQAGIETLSAGQVVQALAYKSGGSGTSYTGTETNLLMVRLAGANRSPSGAVRNFLTVVQTGDPQ
jgi:hypothetical protein